ncbi:MAG: signal recognition particle-docking protein FtsY [Bacillota bacterium]|nr:signal recognition particle-docking protein FtsY [Bacillota bacterium]
MFGWFKRKKKNEEVEEQILEQEAESAEQEAEDGEVDVAEASEAEADAAEAPFEDAEESGASEAPAEGPALAGEEQEAPCQASEAPLDESVEEVQVFEQGESGEAAALPALALQAESEDSDEPEEAAEPEEEPKDSEQYVAPEEPAEQAQALAPEEKKMGAFRSLFSGLNKTRKKIGDQLDNLLNNYREIDEDLYEEIEDILVTADIGMQCTMELIDRLRDELAKRKIKDASLVKGVLKDVMADYLRAEANFEIAPSSPTVILVIGVNGAGKTTSIGKISHRFKQEGKKVVLAAADTFRAAAIDQLRVWAERADVGFVAHSEGSDPSAVIFDGIKSAQAKKADVLICDTAGRLHNKVNLMNELNKMFRIIEREYPEAHKEVLLVLDATTGQNAVNQAKEFLQSAGITGLVLTKLDGTAKGGFVFAIKSELGIPVKLVGVGEKIEDLQTFDPDAYASAILNI